MRTALAGLALAALAGCAAFGASAPPPGVEFVVVRHAEKADASRDPPLGPDGLARADQLARLLAARPLVAAYATEFQRTVQTAQPAAQAHRLPLTRYAADLPAVALARQLRQAHAGGTVLVVGHSNTAPGIAAALCNCSVPPMDDREYDRLMRIVIDKEGRATLDTRRYGAAAAAAPR